MKFLTGIQPPVRNLSFIGRGHEESSISSGNLFGKGFQDDFLYICGTDVLMACRASGKFNC